jgi:hypothetical protein
MFFPPKGSPNLVTVTDITTAKAKPRPYLQKIVRGAEIGAIPEQNPIFRYLIKLL